MWLADYEGGEEATASSYKRIWLFGTSYFCDILWCGIDDGRATIRTCCLFFFDGRLTWRAPSVTAGDRYRRGDVFIGVYSIDIDGRRCIVKPVFYKYDVV